MSLYLYYIYMYITIVIIKFHYNQYQISLKLVSYITIVKYSYTNTYIYIYYNYTYIYIFIYTYTYIYIYLFIHITRISLSLNQQTSRFLDHLAKHASTLPGRGLADRVGVHQRYWLVVYLPLYIIVNMYIYIWMDYKGLYMVYNGVYIYIIWLVVFRLPLWKMMEWKSFGMMTLPIYRK